MSSSAAIPLIVHGITGRMGRRVVALSAADPQHRTTVLAGIAKRGEPEIGGMVDGVPVVEEFSKAICYATAGIDTRVVIVDFSAPDALRELASLAADHGAALVSGTTGLSDADRAILADAAKRIPVVWAPNMSVGVHVLTKLVALAARSLGSAAEVEIVEAHHRHKADAPSGTARKLAEAVRDARAEGVITSGRTGIVPGDRPKNEIAIQSIRMGEIVGDHEVHFALDHEVITLSHRALSRDVFASGALAAARFAAGAAPGLYGINAVVEPGTGHRDSKIS